MKPVDGPGDPELIAACLRGEPEAWEALVRRYANLAYSVPLRFGLSDDDAADVFQNTWSAVWEQLDEVRQRDRLASWLITVASRLSLRAHERRQRHASREVDEAVLALRPDPDPEGRPEEFVVAREETSAVRRAMARLPERCRDLLDALFYDPARPSYVELAERLGVASDTIGPLRGRCLRHLKKLLEEEGFE